MEMPWERKTVEQTRLEFVLRVLAHEKSKSALCREYGISRPTGDKWIARYQSGEDLTDHSRRPFHTPNKISEEMEAEIIAARKAEPAIGARKTRRMFLDNNKENVPSASTINRVFLLPAPSTGYFTATVSLQKKPAKRKSTLCALRRQSRMKCGRQISREISS